MSGGDAFGEHDSNDTSLARQDNRKIRAQFVYCNAVGKNHIGTYINLSKRRAKIAELASLKAAKTRQIMGVKTNIERKKASTLVTIVRKEISM